MQDFERSRTIEWLRRLRGDRNQLEMAADITARTGWSIDRSRYSKYESGSLPFGRDVMAHFQAYADAIGASGPDLTPPAPVPDLAQALVMLATELTALREERQQLVARVSDLELAFAALAESSRLSSGPGAGHAPGARGSQAG